MSSAFLPQEIIRKKRDGNGLSDAEVKFFVQGITDGSVTEGQVAAFAMAIFFQGMNDRENIALTKAMMLSGERMNWRQYGIDGPLVEKHSTGGVGDKVTLMLAPIVAACGALVPTISGRGLGHTGGTLDKLESIPGYDATPDLAHFAEVVKNVGCSIIGQTAELVPADKRFYGIRDVTATIDSIPLITASILSKKLAAETDGLVMDVKFGNGAFMPTYEKAKALTDNLVTIANQAGLPTTALITDMNQVLGHAAGNAVEVKETVDYLTGAVKLPRLHEVTMALAAEMLVIVGVESDIAVARGKAEKALASGKAAETFARMVAGQGGAVDFIENPDKYLRYGPVVRDVTAVNSGYVTNIDTREIGLAVVELGGGRTRADQAVDHRVGFTHCAGLGVKITAGDRLCQVVAGNAADADEATRRIRAAYELGDVASAASPVIYDIIRP